MAMFCLNTADPYFDPARPLKVNGYLYMPAEDEWSDAFIDTFFPDMASPAGRAEIRRQRDELLAMAIKEPF